MSKFFPEPGRVRTTDAVSRWLTASENGDADAAGDCTSPDVVLVSPLTDQFRFRGRDQVRSVMAVVYSAVADIRYYTAICDGDSAALFYRGRVGGHVFDVAQLLRLDSTGLIRELNMFGRPLPALTAFFANIGPEIAAGRGRPALVAIVRASTALLHGVADLGDRRLTPLADPDLR